MRILVVDDDEAIRLLLASRLHELGHQVDVASDGRQAWDKLTAQSPDLLICDWNMPVMNGLELCRKIREAEWPSYLYVILCTAMNQKSDFLEGMDAGADDFAIKPIDFADLRVRVRAAQRIVDLQSELQARNNNLKELYSKLSTAYQTIERDLQAAAALQIELLPKRRAISSSVTLDWFLLPSLFLAGDMLNYFTLDETQLIFYQLDVAGHGIPAALLSVMLNRVLLPVPGSPILAGATGDHASPIASPSAVVAELNRRFQSEGDSYFTILYGIYEIPSRQLTFCQAGHPSPLILTRAGTVRQIGSGGFPVGLVPDMDYEEQIVTLAPGDRVILHSDGITECVNNQQQRYGEERLSGLLIRCAGEPIPKLVELVRSEILDWSGTADLSDDLSMLVLETH